MNMSTAQPWVTASSLLTNASSLADLQNAITLKYQIAIVKVSHHYNDWIRDALVQQEQIKVALMDCYRKEMMQLMEKVNKNGYSSIYERNGDNSSQVIKNEIFGNINQIRTTGKEMKREKIISNIPKIMDTLPLIPASIPTSCRVPVLGAPDVTNADMANKTSVAGDIINGTSVIMTGCQGIHTLQRLERGEVTPTSINLNNRINDINNGNVLTRGSINGINFQVSNHVNVNVNDDLFVKQENVSRDGIGIKTDIRNMCINGNSAGVGTSTTMPHILCKDGTSGTSGTSEIKIKIKTEQVDASQGDYSDNAKKRRRNYNGNSSKSKIINDSNNGGRKEKNKNKNKNNRKNRKGGKDGPEKEKKKSKKDKSKGKSKNKCDIDDGRGNRRGRIRIRKRSRSRSRSRSTNTHTSRSGSRSRSRSRRRTSTRTSTKTKTRSRSRRDRSGGRNNNNNTGRGGRDRGGRSLNPTKNKNKTKNTNKNTSKTKSRKTSHTTNSNNKNKQSKSGRKNSRGADRDGNRDGNKDKNKDKDKDKDEDKEKNKEREELISMEVEMRSGSGSGSRSGTGTGRRTTCTTDDWIEGIGYWRDMDSEELSEKLSQFTEATKKCGGYWKCLKCPKTYRSKTSVLEHVGKDHFNILPFKCDECNKSYFCLRLLNAHKNIHTTKFACKYCDKKFDSNNHLQRHISIHTNYRPFACKDCPKTFSQNDHLKEHIIRVHKKLSNVPKDFAIRIINGNSNNNNNNNDNDNNDDDPSKGPTIINIDLSKMEGGAPSNLDVNMDGYIDVDSLDMCNDDLLEEIDRQLDIRLEKEVITLTKKEMRLDPIVKNRKRKFECSICGSKFLARVELKGHIARLHIHEKVFKCNVCQRTFALLHILRKHQITHTAKHRCDECGKGFDCDSSLMRHKRTHTGEKPYPCNVCGLKCASKSNLKMHLKTHTGEKPYQCHICLTKFLRQDRLKLHILNHKL